MLKETDFLRCVRTVRKEREIEDLKLICIYIYLYTHGRTLCEGKKKKKEFLIHRSHLSSHQREKIIYLHKIIIIISIIIHHPSCKTERAKNHATGWRGDFGPIMSFFFFGARRLWEREREPQKGMVYITNTRNKTSNEMFGWGNVIRQAGRHLFD